MNTDKEIKEMVNRSIAKLLYKTKTLTKPHAVAPVAALPKCTTS